MATPASIVKRVQRRTGTAKNVCLNDLEKRLLNEYQRGFPVSATPFADIAARLGISEALVLKILNRLQSIGVVSRVGPIFQPNLIGASTLAAMAIPAEELEAVAEHISRYEEVNHNYEREDRFNLWFVVTAPNQGRLNEVLEEMERETGYPILNLPLEKKFHIDLGFSLWC